MVAKAEVLTTLHITSVYKQRKSIDLKPKVSKKITKIYSKGILFCGKTSYKRL